MKVVLDTNVFISGVFFSGPPYRILCAWRDGVIEIGREELLKPLSHVTAVVERRQTLAIGGVIGRDRGISTGR